MNRNCRLLLLLVLVLASAIARAQDIGIDAGLAGSSTTGRPVLQPQPAFR